MNQSSPERAGFYFNLGIAYSAMGEYESAIEAYNETLRLDSGYSEAYHNRGKIYHDLGQNDRAIAVSYTHLTLPTKA